MGELGASEEVTQKCGNFLCVNPKHLAIRDMALPPPPNPSGLCQCGCGNPAPLARQTDRKLGYVCGEPVRFVAGHFGNLQRRRLITDSDYAVAERGYETPCWICATAPLPSGYARLKVEGRTRLAHRAMFEQEVGPIPPGHDVHHVCRQRACIRPDHLLAVTKSEHGRRGISGH